MGRARGRLDAGPPKVRGCLPPGFTLAAVKPDGRIVRLQIFRVHVLQSPRHLAMENLPLKREKPVADNLADSLMGEVQSLSDPVENTPPHKFLDTFSRVSNAETGGNLKNREFEFSADHGRHRPQLLPARA